MSSKWKAAFSPDSIAPSIAMCSWLKCSPAKINLEARVLISIKGLLRVAIKQSIMELSHSFMRYIMCEIKYLSAYLMFGAAIAYIKENTKP